MAILYGRAGRLTAQNGGFRLASTARRALRRDAGPPSGRQAAAVDHGARVGGRGAAGADDCERGCGAIGDPLGRRTHDAHLARAGAARPYTLRGAHRWAGRGAPACMRLWNATACQC
jgi:hypothetical protein